MTPRQVLQVIRKMVNASLSGEPLPENAPTARQNERFTFLKIQNALREGHINEN